MKTPKWWTRLFGRVVDTDPDALVAELAAAREQKERAEAANREASSRVYEAVDRLLSEYRRLHTASLSGNVEDIPSHPR